MKPILKGQKRLLVWHLKFRHSRACYSSMDFKIQNIVPLTCERQPTLKRHPFAHVQEKHVIKFKEILGHSPGSVLYSPNVHKTESDSGHGAIESGRKALKTDYEDLLIYNMDWMRKYRGSSQLVLKPKTTDQVSQILKYCNEEELALVPQGGNTGLVGGSVPVFDEVILSTSKMDSIESFDEVSGVVVCQPGVILEKLDDWLREKQHMCPLDLGAKGSCQIGGNVATNAGGLRLLRYGSLHGTVLGIEAVLADGSVLDGLSALRKDNTGLDLKQLFIGSEGTLGIITKIALLTPRKPVSVQVAMLRVENYESVQTLFSLCKTHLSEILSAFEFWDTPANHLVLGHLNSVRNPFVDLESESSDFFVLIETQGSNVNHDTEKLMNLLELVLDRKVAKGGVLAQDSTQAANMWNIREGIPEACSKYGATYKYDVSLPVPVLYGLVKDMRKRLSDKGLYTDKGSSLVKQVIGFGHLGDGNLHLNITADRYDETLLRTIEPFIYEWTQNHKGSISAEHGLGMMKAPFLHYSKPQEMIDCMRKIKKVFDPKGILNPYKYLPSQE